MLFGFEIKIEYYIEKLLLISRRILTVILIIIYMKMKLFL